jgi:hypothetical protein
MNVGKSNGSFYEVRHPQINPEMSLLSFYAQEMKIQYT